MNDLPTITELLIVESARIKEQVIRQVMEHVLGRPVMDTDAKDFQLVTHNLHPGREFIGYKGNMLGELIWKFEGVTVSYIFEPKTVIV